MQEIRLTTWEAVLYVALIGMAAGFLLGLVPLIYGWRKAKTKLGLVGFIVSIVAGAVSPILSLLTLVIFVFLIARKQPMESTSAEPVDDPDSDSDPDSLL